MAVGSNRNCGMVSCISHSRYSCMMIWTLRSGQERCGRHRVRSRGMCDDELLEFSIVQDGCVTIRWVFGNCCAIGRPTRRRQTSTMERYHQHIDKIHRESSLAEAHLHANVMMIGKHRKSVSNSPAADMPLLELPPSTTEQISICAPERWPRLTQLPLHNWLKSR